MHQFVTVLNSTGDVFDLTTVEAANAEFDIDSSTDTDAITQAQITSASQMIAEMCGRVFGLQTVRETFRIKHSDYWNDALNASRYPIVEVTSLTVGGVELDASSYEINYDAGVIYRTRGRWHPGSLIVMEYSGGYNLPDGAPAGLARACLELMRQHRATQGTDNSLSIRDIWAGENRVSYFDSTAVINSSDSTIAGLLGPYRRLAV